MTSRALGTDSINDVVLVLALYVIYLVLDRLTQALAAIDRADLGHFALVGGAIANRWWLYVAVAIAVGVAVVRRRERILLPWGGFEHGSVLRLLALPLIVYLGWKGAFYPYNFVADEAHLLDRVLVVTFAAAALARPAFLALLVVQFRIISEQTLFPFGTAASKNIDEFLAVALLVIAAGYVLYVITGNRRTSPVLLALSTVVAAHFYVPGKAKLAIGWLTETDIANLPLGSHTAGWLGHTDGWFAQQMSDFFATFSVPVMIATLVLEAGAVVAVYHPRLLRWWLPGWVLFHVVTFASTGFFFIGWAALEIGLLVVLLRPSLREWVVENATPARGLIAVLAVIGSPVLFHPPGLAWLDAPVSYGYEVEATGESGTAYHVPLSAFAPLDSEMLFTRLHLGPTVPLSGGYGSLTTAAEMDRLALVSTFEELAALEAEQPPTTYVDESQAFIVAFFDRANAERSADWLRRLAPPSHYWSSREAPSYDFEEPLSRLQMYSVTVIHGEGSPSIRRELVLQVESGPDGRGVVVNG